eukprot:SAG31_NODE_70_length_28117_cov_100.521843_22_plen_64_part_00
MILRTLPISHSDDAQCNIVEQRGGVLLARVLRSGKNQEFVRPETVNTEDDGLLISGLLPRNCS